MPQQWAPSHQPPTHSGNYWSQLASLTRQSVRPPHPGLPVVTQRNSHPALPSRPAPGNTSVSDLVY